MTGQIIALVLIGIVIVYPAFYYILYEPLRVLFRTQYLVFSARLDESRKSYLSKNFTFYKSLNIQNQARFERRVAFMLRYKKFRGIDFEVTDEIKTFISACAVQLTFGLRNFWITEFDEFRITGDPYHLENYTRKAMGHVSGRGIITLSWKNVIQGYSNPTDGVNVGLHEMAHALMISSVEKGWNIDFAAMFHEWEKAALIEWKRHRDQHVGVFREYAYLNMFEFFAVAVEYFFERPAEFRDRAPELYNEMMRLLRLDPLNGAAPVLHRIPPRFPSQKIPLPRYSPYELLRITFRSGLSTMDFIAGTLSWLAGIYLLFTAIKANEFNYKPGGMGPVALSWLAGMAFFCGMCLYILVFYREKDEQK